jgi:hypothetical protein
MPARFIVELDVHDATASADHRQRVPAIIAP